MTFDKSKPPPKWIIESNPTCHRSRWRRKWYLALWYAQPPWADRKKINAIYREAKRMRSEGRDVVVDHIHPLHAPDSCGLHVHYNLRIIERKTNAWLSNVRQQHSPQDDLFDNMIAPPDFELEIQ